MSGYTTSVKSLLTLQDYKMSMENETPISDICCGVEILTNGERKIPSLIFRCEGFKFFLPYFNFPLIGFEEDDDIEEITNLFLGIQGAVISFLVEDITENMSVGILNKKESDALLQLDYFFHKSDQQINVNDVKEFSIITVVSKKIMIEGYGIMQILSLSDFPNIKYLDFTRLYSKNDKLKCKIEEIVLPKKEGEILNVSLSPFGYPSSDSEDLRLNSYYIGEVYSMTKNSVTVDCGGKFVSCNYPVSIIPYIHARVVLKIVSQQRPDRNNFYRGSIIFCEHPVGAIRT